MGFLSSLGSNLVADVIVGLVVLLMGYLGLKKPQVARAFLYALLAGFLGASTLYLLNHRTATTVTTDNIETVIHGWLDGFGLATRMNPTPGTNFAMVVTLKSGRQVEIVRLNDRDRYLFLQTNVEFAPDLKADFVKLTGAQKLLIAAEIQLELARVNFTNVITTPADLRTVFLEYRVPITADLTEDVFARSLDFLDSGVNLVQDSAILALRRQAESK
jgi:hypothetical protein